MSQKNKKAASYGKPVGRPKGTTGIPRAKKPADKVKVKAYRSLSQQTIGYLEQYAKYTGKSQSELIDLAVFVLCNDHKGWYECPECKSPVAWEEEIQPYCEKVFCHTCNRMVEYTESDTSMVTGEIPKNSTHIKVQ